MNERQALILKTIIQEYIKTGLPVSSQAIVDNYQLAVSSATIRNEMAELESDGLIAQPHTSAGRLPTPAAFKWYARDLSAVKPDARESKILDTVLRPGVDCDCKLLAKTLAGLSDAAAFWAKHRHHIYYTGLTNLLTQPEFASQSLVGSISAVIDSLDDIVNDYFDHMTDHPTILVGGEGPFGDFCSSVLWKYQTADGEAAFGILGPLRMDYSRNLGLLSYVYQQLN